MKKKSGMDLRGHFEFTRRINQILREESDSKLLIEKICLLFMEAGSFRFIWIVLFEEQSNSVSFASQGLGEMAGKIREIFREKQYTGSIGQAIQSMQPVVLSPGQNERTVRPDFKNSFLYTWPLYSDGQLWGVLEVAVDKDSLWSVNEFEMLDEICHGIAFTISRIYQWGNVAQTVEDELKESTRKMETLLANLPGLAYSCLNNRNYDMKYISSGCMDLLGYEPEELIDNPDLQYSDLVYEADRKYVWDEVQKALRRDGSFELEYRIITKSGLQKWVWEKGKRVQSDGKETLEGFIADISSQRTALSELDAAQKHFRALIENAPDGVAIVDERGLMSYVSPNTYKLLGYNHEEIIGHPGAEFVHPDDQVSVEKVVESVMVNPEQKQTIQYRLKKKDGNYCWLETTFSNLIGESAVGGMVLNFTDVTDRRKALEDLKQAKEKAEESDRLKSAFLATMSHELRTPLNHIIGFSRLIHEMTEDQDIRKYSGIVRNSGNNLLEIIEDIFRLARAEQSEVTIRKDEVVLVDIFTELSLELQELIQASDKGGVIDLKLVIAKGITRKKIITDRPKVIQLVSNILRNAVKYTHKGFISLNVDLEEEGLLLISVGDSGIGIQKEKLDVIFDFFRQGDDSHTRKYGGVGIGLALARKIADALDGEIILHSEFGQGSEFVTRIPVTILEEELEISKVDPAKEVFPDLASKSILLAEDDELSIDLVKALLKMSGCELLIANNGAEAIEKMAQHPEVDLILMDLKMPVMDGFMATEKIRKKNSRIPIVAMTAYSFDENHRRAIDAGCNEVITKPVTKGVLLERLKHYLAGDNDSDLKG